MARSAPAPRSARRRFAGRFAGITLALVVGAATAGGCASGTGSPTTPTLPLTTWETPSSTWAPSPTLSPEPTTTTEITTSSPAVVAPAPVVPHTAASHTVAKTQTRGSSSGSCAANEYRNVNGNCVQRPTHADSAPAGATARCHDGTYSFSQNRRGTCSSHGGVAEWL